MLRKLLSPDDLHRFLLYAELLSISDKPLLWDGKDVKEITSTNGKEKISFKKGEAESELLADWRKNIKDAPPGNVMQHVLIHLLKDVPLYDCITNPEGVQWNAVASALHRALGGGIKYQLEPDSKKLNVQIINQADQKTEADGTQNPYVIRIMLYELMLMALADGQISAIEYRFLEEFKRYYKIDDLAFEEIRERAESMYRETQKTIALVLE